MIGGVDSAAPREQPLKKKKKKKKAMFVQVQIKADRLRVG